jgi:nucleoside 2-deoxyribosyltransferase
MRCFVASALGYADVDLIYDKAICPVLKELKIKPFRVDRVEHNEDIDDQIFKLIDSADLCVADLTYARPSVYYEAGYAFGTGMPVVYIAKSDHFKAQDKDPLGNLRVHFDLQMKNIIPWTAPNKTFCKRLRSRIRLVTKPILRVQKVAKKTTLYEKKFSALSLKAQLSSLTKKGINICISKGYRIGRLSRTTQRGHDPTYMHLVRIKNSLSLNIHIITVPSVTKILFNKFLRFLLLDIDSDSTVIKTIETLFLIASIRSARKATLISGLSEYSPVTDRIFTWQYPYGGKTEHLITVGIIDGVKSVEGFTEKLKDITQQTNF